MRNPSDYAQEFNLNIASLFTAHKQGKMKLSQVMDFVELEMVSLCQKVQSDTAQKLYEMLQTELVYSRDHSHEVKGKEVVCTHWKERLNSLCTKLQKIIFKGQE